MKSAPACIATWLARATKSKVLSSPVARIAFIRAGPQASRIAASSSWSAAHSPRSARPREMTMSISAAPCSKA